MDLHGLRGFDWDEGNHSKILAKHGVLPCQVEQFFASRPDVGFDAKHSVTEDRFLAVGRGPQGRWLLASFTIRIKAGRRLLRPISVRYMHAKEVESYEKGRKLS